MRAQTAKRMMRMQEWAMQISDCKQSGQTVRQWCCENGVKVKTFYNRMRVVREEMLEIAETVNASRANDSVRNRVVKMLPEQNKPGTNGENQTGQLETPVFAALPMPRTASAAVTVRIGSCAIDVQNGADPSVVEQVLRLAVQL